MTALALDHSRGRASWAAITVHQHASHAVHLNAWARGAVLLVAIAVALTISLLVGSVLNRRLRSPNPPDDHSAGHGPSGNTEPDGDSP